MYCPTSRIEKCVFISTKKWLVSTTLESANSAATFWMFLFRIKNWQLCCLVVMVHIVLQERRVATIQKSKSISFFEEVFPPITVTRTKKGWIESNYGINVSVSHRLMMWATYSFFNSFYSISIYCQPGKFNQLTVNLQKIIMIFSSTSHGIQWTLDFGPVSVTIAVNDLDQIIKISSQKIRLAAWQLLLSQR